MKNIVIIFICISFTNIIKSQTIDTSQWCPPGATWVYSFGTWGAITFNEYKYVKDTIYKGITAKKIEHNFISFNGPTYPYNKVVSYLGDELMYLSNDSLFYFDPINDEYVFYFDFNANVSDTLFVKNSREECLSDSLFPNSDILTIFSNRNDTIGNVIIKVFQMNDLIQSKNYIIGDIYKNIGSSYSFLPRINPNNCISPSSANNGEGLVCYYDSLRGYLFQGTILLDCNEIYSGYTLIDKENEIKYFLNIYPNPTDNVLFLETFNTNSVLKTYKIFNIYGQLIKYGNLENNQINIQEIPDGSYILALFDISNYRFTAKFTK